MTVVTGPFQVVEPDAADVDIAFLHVAEFRPTSTSPTPSPRHNYLVDRIALEGLAFTGRHGVLDEERQVAQRFGVDIEIEMDLSRSGHTDAIEDTFDYRHAHAIAKQVVEGDSVHLLEALATRIADRLLGEHARIGAVTVRVSKRPPLDGEVKAAAVSIRRTRA